METNINIVTINKYFNDLLENNNYEDNSNARSFNYRTKIINYSFFSINETRICGKITKIPYYSNYYSILYDYDLLDINQLNENIIEKVKKSDINDYLLFKYDDKNSIDFTEYLYNFNSIKKLIFNMIDTFQHLLKGLCILNEYDICFFNLSPQNIIFLENYRAKPVITNFRFSLNINRLDYTFISKFLTKIDNFTYQPFEVNLLFYFVNNNLKTVSHSFIEEFCEIYIKNLCFLRLFSENYKKKYKEQCIEMIKKYVNKPKKEIVDDILERYDKWDIYGISLIYLQIFGCISQIFSLKGTFISKITLELSKNLHPDSEKRMSLEKTLDLVNRLLCEQNDWNFVNKLYNFKLQQLFDELAK